jgi:hypothetical protein
MTLTDVQHDREHDRADNDQCEQHDDEGANVKEMMVHEHDASSSAHHLFWL